MSELVIFQVEAGEIWEESERTTIQQAALDIGKAIARDIHRDMEHSASRSDAPSTDGEMIDLPIQMELADAFLKVFGRPVRFLKKAETADLGNWGFTTRRDLVWVYRNAPHFNDDDRFAVWATGRNLLSMSWAMLLKM